MVTVHYGSVSDTNPPMEIEKAFRDQWHAYAFTIGTLLAVLCQRDPRNLQNPELIAFDQQVRNADPKDYPSFLSQLNDMIGTMDESYQTLFGSVRHQTVPESDAEMLLRQ